MGLILGPKKVKLVIDKEDVIEALERERLVAGNFVIGWGAPDCSMCAVGATLRRAGLAPPDEYRFDTVAYDDVTKGASCASSCAPTGNWLSALSIVWEYLNQHNVERDERRLSVETRWERAERLRPDIVRWAEDNIPDDWETEIAVDENWVVAIDDEEAA